MHHLLFYLEIVSTLLYFRFILLDILFALCLLVFPYLSSYFFVALILFLLRIRVWIGFLVVHIEYLCFLDIF